MTDNFTEMCHRFEAMDNFLRGKTTSYVPGANESVSINLNDPFPKPKYKKRKEIKFRFSDNKNIAQALNKVRKEISNER